MLHQLRYSLRQLLKTPGFTITAILILGFSIGLSTAIFSLIDAVILKPLPFPNSERLVEVCEPYQHHPFSVFDYPDYVDLAAAQHTFDALGLKVGRQVDLRTNGEAQLLEADFVSPSMFRITGLPMILGRVFTEQEDIPNGPLVAVLSERCWRSRFQSDPSIIGRNVVLSDLSVQVIGIVPTQMDDWGPPGNDVYLPIHAIVAFHILDADVFADRAGGHFFTCFGRLKEGVKVSEGETDLKTIQSNLLIRYPGENQGRTLQVFPLLSFIVNDYATTIWLLAAAVSVLLIVSCLDIANLLFARGLYRRREIMIRATLGASRWRVVGQLLVETLLLTSIGGILGIGLANVCVWGTKSLIPIDLYRFQELQVDWKPLGFTFCAIIVAALVAGLLPAWSLSQATLAPALEGEGGRTGTGGLHRHRIQTILVTAQVALTSVLLVGAGLLIRSFYATQTVELGFNPNHLFKAGISLTSVKYEYDAKTVAFWDELITKVRQKTGATDAATIDAPPLAGHRWDISPFMVDGQPKPEPGHEPVLTPAVVSSGYFRTMQIPIIEGRDFNAEDTSDKENVVIVNAALAQHFFPGQSPIGKSIRIRYTGYTQCTIVGVVPYVCDRTPGEEDIPFQSYQPYAQVVRSQGDLIIRSDLSASSLASAVRQAVSSIDPGIPIHDAYPYEQMIAEQFVTRRLSTLLVTLFSTATLFLSAVGLYGILSYSVGQRSREIGIRMALGAEAPTIMRLVAEQGLRPVAVGVTIGIFASLLLTRFIQALLYGVSAYDPIVVGLTFLVLGIASLLACLLPAVKAIRINPVKVLNE
ncbi:MAG TPA: ABC transporter permease [Chthoniobacterales bacterium]